MYNPNPFNLFHKEFYNKALYNSDYKNELEYSEYISHKCAINNIGNNIHKNMGNNGSDNNANMDNK